MVALIEQQTEIQTTLIESPIDRPDGWFIFINSQRFYLKHEDILPERYGVVASLVTDEEQPTEARHTIAFDAQSTSPNFRWEYTYSPKLNNAALGSTEQGRRVKQIEVTQAGELSGWSAKYDMRGRLVTVQGMGAYDSIVLWGNINDTLSLESVQQETVRIRAKKAAQEERLAWFVVNHEHEYLTAAADSSRPHEEAVLKLLGKNNNEMLKFKGRLSAAKFEEEFKKQKKYIKNMGFVALQPSQRPE